MAIDDYLTAFILTIMLTIILKGVILLCILIYKKLKKCLITER